MQSSFTVLLFFDINTEVLDETRLGGVPWACGKHIHIHKLDRRQVFHNELFYIVDDHPEVELPVQKSSWDTLICVHLSIAWAGNLFSTDPLSFRAVSTLRP